MWDPGDPMPIGHEGHGGEAMGRDGRDIVSITPTADGCSRASGAQASITALTDGQSTSYK